MAAPARPKVVLTRTLPEPTEARMAELFDVITVRPDRPLSQDELEAAVATADVLVPTVTDTIDAALIAKAGSRLKLIANFGNGVDHIDLAAARAGGIVVTNTPGVLTEDSADMAMALLLAVPRRFAEGAALIQSGEWTGWSPTGMLGRRVNGKTLGIVGMGRIGQAIATRARGFGIAIRYHNRRRLPGLVEGPLAALYRAELDPMIQEVDFLSINCPHTTDTHHLIDARRLKLLGPRSYLINIARGGIVDERALIEALRHGEIAGAGLDVYEREPRIDARLRALPNAFLLPHMVSATHEAREATGNKVIANIRAWVDGHRSPDQILEGWS